MELIDRSEKFVGFYSKDGFWVDEIIDLHSPEKARKMLGIIPEIVISVTFKKFRVVVCVDGLMLLRVEHLAQAMPSIGDPSQLSESLGWWDEHLDYANALQLCIESESIKSDSSSEIISTSVLMANTCRVGFIDGSPVNRSFESNRSLVSARHDLAIWIANGMQAELPQAASAAWMSWNVVPKSVIYSAIDVFKIVCEDKDLVKWLSFIAKAKTAHFNNDFRSAFMFLWFVIESAIKSIATRLGRMPRSYPPVSSIIKDLHSKGIVSGEVFEQLSMLRREVRNKLVHEPGSAVCLPHHSMAAAKLAIELVVTNPAIALNTKWITGAQF